VMTDKVQLLKDWIEKEGRKQTWVAQQIGCSPQWLNYVLKGKKPLSDKLALTLHEKLGIPLSLEPQVAPSGKKPKADVKAKKRRKS
jgi:antitoxin component HigA of HigAB toxin-antitoxin module